MAERADGGSEDSVVEGLLDEYRQARLSLESLASEFADIGQRMELQLDSAVLTGAPSPPRFPSRLEVRCLGGFEVLHNRARLPLRPGKPLNVLKFLAAAGGRPVPRDQLLETVWPEAPPDTAANRLRVAIHGLRQASGAGAGDLIHYADGHYRVGVDDPVQIDAELFELEWERGQQLEREGRVDDAIRAYRSAKSLYRGDYMGDDRYEEWTLVRREYLRDANMNLLFRLASLSYERGDSASCITLCNGILQQDDCNEEAYRLLMRSLARRGQRARALRWFLVCESALRTELQTDPSPETVALRNEILAGY